MTTTIPDVLSRIVDRKRQELHEIQVPIAELEHRAELSVMTRRPFAAALRGRSPAIIAEIKQASPSKGLLTANYDPSGTAIAYQDGGAAALSVLTDEHFFQGSLEHLEEARNAVRLPVLRKDFIIGEVQILEAAARGADAILLIAAILTVEELQRFRALAAQFLMAALVEVHDGEELKKALDSGAAILGVNNRDLHTFEVRMETSLDLAERIPGNLIRVSESGIRTPDDISVLSAAGFNAFLIGEHLMKAADPAAKLRELRCS